jgi:plasmid stabilization system protein ParE
MAGPSRVEWTPEAREQLHRIHQFVQEQWSARIADRFLDLVMAFEDLILKYPHGFQASPMHPELRMGVIHRNVKAIYRVDADRVLILTLVDTRADNRAWF